MRVELKQIKVVLPGTNRLLFSIDNFCWDRLEPLLIEGQSGQGKSTLLHLIAGLFTSPGQVVLGECEIGKLSPGALCEFRRKNVGVIFQKLNVIDHLSARENIELAQSSVRASKDPARSIVAAMQAVGIQELANTRAGLLSGGEQQRVAVARVLAQRPPLILADEPTSNLDDANADLVIKSLIEVAKGGTLLVISHDQRLRPYFRNCMKFSEMVKM